MTRQIYSNRGVSIFPEVDRKSLDLWLAQLFILLMDFIRCEIFLTIEFFNPILVDGKPPLPRYFQKNPTGDRIFLCRMILH